MREPSLRPVLLVVIGHAAAFVAPMLLLALRDGRPGAMAVLLAVALLTAASVSFDLRRSRRPAALSALLLSVWLLSAGVAYVADRTGVF